MSDKDQGLEYGEAFALSMDSIWADMSYKIKSIRKKEDSNFDIFPSAGMYAILRHWFAI